MNLAFYLNIILLPRMFFYFNEKPLNRNRNMVLLLSRLFVLVAFRIDIWTILSLVIILLADLYIIQKEKNGNVSFPGRTFSLCVYLIIGIIAGSRAINLRIDDNVFLFLEYFKEIFNPMSFMDKVTGIQFNYALLGVIILTTESNIFIKYVFEKLKIYEKGIDEAKISAGRIIGLLERYFIYLFVLLGSYEIIIFIVAMKGLARYNETKDKSFAEYFLIGSLLSIFISVIISLLIKLIF